MGWTQLWPYCVLVFSIQIGPTLGDNMRRNYRDEVSVGDPRPELPEEIDIANLELFLFTENIILEWHRIRGQEPHPRNFHRRRLDEYIPRHCVEWFIFGFFLCLFCVAIFLH